MFVAFCMYHMKYVYRILCRDLEFVSLETVKASYSLSLRGDLLQYLDQCTSGYI